MLFKGWPPQYFWAMRGGGGSDKDIVVRPTTPVITEYPLSKEWEFRNDTGYPLFVQTFDPTGDEMHTDVTG